MKRTPLVLLTGFLGAGKTTALNCLLASEDFSETAVLINEAGEVGLDHMLVEHAPDSVVMLSGGCVCCRTRGSLVPALAALLRKQRDERLSPFKRIVVETSGLTDPSALLEELAADVFFSRNFSLAGVVTMIDARAFEATIGDHAEARMQVALADRLLLTKTDLTSADQVANVKRTLSAINPHAPQISITSAAVIYSDFWPEALDLPRSLLATETVSRPSDDPVPVATASLVFDGELSEADLEDWLNDAVGLLGPALLRMKALIDVEGVAGPTALHIVQGQLHRPLEMSAWPEQRRLNRIVLIGRDVEQQILVDLLAQLSALVRLNV
jgi:G3E family GTPase